MDSQSITPFWADKALWLVVLSSLLPPISKWLGIQLDPAAVYGLAMTVATYVVAHKAKSWAILKQELAADALAKAKQVAQSALGPAAKALLVALALGIGLLHSPSANAAPTVHFQPSPVIYEFRLSGQVGQLAPGLAEKAWLDFGHDTLFQPELILSGEALGLLTAHPGAAVSLAPGICYAPIGICLDVGTDLGGSLGGLFYGFTPKKNLFAGVSFQPKFLEILHLSTG